MEEGDVESLFPATVSADGTILVNKKKIKLKKDCGLYKEEPHLSLRLGKYCSVQYVTLWFIHGFKQITLFFCDRTLSQVIVIVTMSFMTTILHLYIRDCVCLCLCMRIYV